MAGVFNSTLESDEINPFHIILETPPPEVVDEISRYFDASLEQNRQTSEVCHSMVNDHIESGSDSGDSLFITQKNPVPEVVRSQKRCLSRSTSEPAPTREPEGSEDDIESSISSSAATSATYSKRRKWQNRTLREYSFPFIRRPCGDKYQRRRRDIYLPVQQNAALVSSAIGGFFKCVKALEKSTKIQQSYMDERETLSPLSEEEERWDDDDMKVVQKKLFSTSLKQKCPQKDRDSANVKRPRRWIADVRQASPRIPQKTQEWSRPILQRTCKLTGVQAQKKVKKRRKKKNKEKGEEGVELPTGQEGSEGQNAAGPCVTVEITQEDRTPGLTEEDRLEPSVPQSSDAMEPREDHDDEDAITQRTDYKPMMKKKGKRYKSDVHFIMTEGLEKDKSQNVSLDSELMDCATVVKESSSLALHQDSELGSSAEPNVISQRTLEGNTDEIGAEHSVSQSLNSTLEDDGNLEQPNVRMELVSVVPESPVSNGGWKKRHNKRKTVSEQIQDEPDAIELSCDAAARPPNDDVETRVKKKKGKKEKRREIITDIIEDHEGEKLLNLNFEPQLVELSGQVEESGSSTPTLRPGLGLCLGSTEIDQRASESTMAEYTEHFMESSASLLGDIMEPILQRACKLTGVQEQKKVKKRRKKKKKEKGEEGVELPTGQEGSEVQNAAGPCVTVEITQEDRTPGLTEEDRLEPSVPQSSDAMEPREDHDDEDAITQRTDYKPMMKKKGKRYKSDVHFIMTEGLEKDKSQNVSLDSELMDCATVVKESSSLALHQDSELGSSAEPDVISQRTLEGNTDEIGAEHSVSQSLNSTLEDDGNLEQPNVRMELVSVVPESPVSNGGWKKRHNKRKTVSEQIQDEPDAIELSCDAAARPPNDDVETRVKKKKRKKEKRREIIEDHEGEKLLNLNFEPQLVELSGQVEESGSSTPTLRPGLGLCLGSTEIDQRASESTMAEDTEHFMESSASLLGDIMEPRKKHQKKLVQSSNDDSKGGQEEENVDNAHPDGAVTLNENLGLLLKRKKKKKQKKTSVEEEETNIPKVTRHTEINPKLGDAATCQKTTESLVAQYVERTTRKKKQKEMIEKSTTHLSEDTAAQSDDSVSVQKKEKSVKGAFLVADTVEKDTETNQETSVPTQTQLVPERKEWKRQKIDRPDTFDLEMEPGGDVEKVQESATGSNDMSLEKKRKRKKKSSTLEDTAVNHDRDFDQPNTEYPSSVSEAKSCSEAIDTGFKRKRKHKKDKELETHVTREESAVDIERSQTDEATVLKKKHKYCSVIQENTATTVKERLQSERSTLMHSSSVKHRIKKRKLSVSFDPENGHGRSAEICHDDKGTDQMKNVKDVCEINTTMGAEHATNSSEAPENPVSNAAEGKKRGGKRKSTDNVIPEGKSCAHSVTLTEQQSQNCESKCIEIQSHTKKKKEKERNKPSPTLKGPAGEQAEVGISEVTSGGPVLSDSNSVPPFETACSSNHSKKKRCKKDKRRLYDPKQDYLGTDYDNHHNDTHRIHCTSA